MERVPFTYHAYIRHGFSEYNSRREEATKDPNWKKFQLAYRNDYHSDESIKLAEELHNRYGLEELIDADIPLTEVGIKQAFETGKGLREIIKLPKHIFVSPYLRTLQTLQAMEFGWPELMDVPRSLEDELKARSYGDAEPYIDRRLYMSQHPDEYLRSQKTGEYRQHFSNGETIADVRKRHKKWENNNLRELEEDVLIVTHQFLIEAVIANNDKLSIPDFMDEHHRQNPINCGVTIFQYQAPNKSGDSLYKLDPKHNNIRLYSAP